MKERFTTIDVFSVLQDLRESVLGMRVANVYDVDHKTYLIKLAKPDVKQVLLFESGCRIHTTEFEWPKGMQPSGFSMKLRKHLRTRRLVAITQLGIDRVLDLQFGSDQAAYHLIIELYDRGNVILTDCNYIILSLLRTRTDADAEVRFAVRETFSQDTVKREQPLPSRDQVQQMLSSAKKGDQLKHVLNPHFVYGTALLTHCLLGADISDTAKIGSGFNPEEDIDKVMCALKDADQLFRRLRDNQSKGIVVQKREPRPQMVDTPAVTMATCGEGGDGEQYLLTNVEFHPMLFRQHERCPYKEFPTLSKAVDEFFSSKSSQKQDLKALNVQKTAVKKLDNVRRDHQKRIDELQKKQVWTCLRDLYVHADLHGAPSVIIKNPQGGPVPPRTLNEAGSMAVCYSSAWESRIVTSAWWVHSHQVSKTAPAGEYLTTGSFMVRGKKNFLPPCDLTMGFGFLFKVDETCIPRHLHERKIRSEDDQLSVLSDTISELTVVESVDDEEELEVEDDLEQAEGEEEEEEEEEESMFPDTIITLEHVGGGRFELQRGTSVASSRSIETERGPSPGEGGAVKEDVAEKRHQHLSAKQRREMKKQGKQNGTEDADPTPTSQKKKKQQPLPQAQPPQVKRGQKAKQRKIRDKYGDQDEEERQMRMDILASGRPSKQQQVTGKKGQRTKKDPNQSTNPKHKYHQKSKGKNQGQSPTVTETTHHKQMPPVFVVASSVVGNDKDEISLTPTKEPKGSEMIVEDIEAVAEMEEMVGEGEGGEGEGEGEGERGRGEVGGVDREAEGVGGEGKCESSGQPPVDEVESPGADAAEGKGTTVGTAMEEAAEVTRHEDSDEEEKKAILADENIQQLEDQDKDQVSVLDSFTGCPVPEDIMLYAIPVCAPYTAVTNYKHKVKLVPGTNKRGKAARAALHRFIQSRESSAREKDLLKSVKDNDLSRYIPGKVKISIPQTQTHRHPRR